MNKGKRKRAAKSNWVREVLGEWAEAALENDCDPLGLKGAPEWVLNAYAECTKVILPSGLPPADKWDAELLGEFLGRFRSLPHLFAGEVPLESETQAEIEKLKAKITKQPSPKNLKKTQKDAETVFDATEKATLVATVMASNSTYGDACGFQKGLLRGIEIKPEELKTSRALRRHTSTFWFLFLFWRTWVKCRSVREIYDHLCKARGEKEIGSFKTFENHVAKKIGLKLRGRGRPAAAK